MEAPTLDPRFPELFQRLARKNMKKEDDDIEEKVEPYQDMIYPECQIASAGGEDPEELK